MDKIVQEMDESVEGITVTENSPATSAPSKDVFSEKMNQELQGTNVFKNIDQNILKKTPAPNTEEDFEMMDITAEDITLTENLVVTSGLTTEGIGQKADVQITNRETTLTESTAGIREITDEDARNINPIKNLLASPESSAEGVSEATDQTAENFKVNKFFKVSYVPASEMFAEIMDLDEINETDYLVAVLESNSGEMNGILDKTTENISVTGNIKTTPLPNAERISEIIDKVDEVFGVTEHLDAAPVSSTFVDEAHVPKENTTNIMDDKEMNINNENEVENETPNIVNGETKNLKIALERKRKCLKRQRKIVHPSISEMVMDSIISLNKNTGVSFKDIKANMEENYSVKVKAIIKNHVINFLHKWVETGILEKVDKTDAEDRFRIRKGKIQ